MLEAVNVLSSTFEGSGRTAGVVPVLEAMGNAARKFWAMPKKRIEGILVLDALCHSLKLVKARGGLSLRHHGRTGRSFRHDAILHLYSTVDGGIKGG